MFSFAYRYVITQVSGSISQAYTTEKYIGVFTKYICKLIALVFFDSYIKLKP